MKEVYIVTKENRPVIAFVNEKTAMKKLKQYDADSVISCLVVEGEIK